jgi:hypothetical protein
MLKKSTKLIVLDINNKLNLPLFPVDMKETVMNKVLDFAENNTLLSNLTKNYSWEGGFELPLTSEWIDAINNQNESYSIYLKYHNSRDFRFTITGEQIDGIRVKDNMRCWSTEEKDELLRLITLAIG